jgi:hypothetical protein
MPKLNINQKSASDEQTPGEENSNLKDGKPDLSKSFDHSTEESKEIEAEPMLANEFICEACTYKNIWRENDMTSARCEMCQEKNEVISDMIYSGMM